MLVTAPDDVRRRRLTAKLTDSEFRRRRAQQMPEEEKIARSDFVFDNTGSRKELREFVGQTVASILAGDDRPWGTAPARPLREAPAHRRRPVWRRARGRGRRRALGGAAVRASGGPPWYTQTVYPLEHAGAIRAGARRYDLDPALVAAVVYAESRFDEHALSSQGAVGLMQILPETAEQIADESGGVTFTTADLEDPRINVRYGSYYLRQALDVYDGDVRAAVASYNAGMGAVGEWVAARAPRGTPAAPARHPVPGDAGLRGEGPRGAPGIPGDVRRPPAAAQARDSGRPPLRGSGPLANMCSCW